MSNAPLPVVIAVAGDAGGANALAPVIERLRDENHVSIKPFAYRQAREFWSRRDLAYCEISESVGIPEVRDLLIRSDAALVLAGTSVNEVDLEKKFLLAARQVNVPSLAVLDHWSCYKERFSNKKDELVYMPDKLAIMDERARQEMLAVGFNNDYLSITGLTAHDDLNFQASRFDPETRMMIRRQLGIGEEELFVLFVSQSLKKKISGYDQKALSFGFTERQVIPAFMAALDNISESTNSKVVLVIRPHPREDIGWLDISKSHRFKLVVSGHGDARDVAMASNLVVGMNSMLLIEACYLGCLTVSLQPGLNRPDPVITNALGLSKAVYRYEDFEPVIQEMLFDEERREAYNGRLHHLRAPTGATSRVVSLAYDMINPVKLQGRL